MKNHSKEGRLPNGTIVMISPNIEWKETTIFPTSTMIELGKERFRGRIIDSELTPTYRANPRYLYYIDGFGFRWEREWLIPIDEVTLYDLV